MSPPPPINYETSDTYAILIEASSGMEDSAVAPTCVQAPERLQEPLVAAENGLKNFKNEVSTEPSTPNTTQDIPLCFSDLFQKKGLLSVSPVSSQNELEELEEKSDLKQAISSHGSPESISWSTSSAKLDSFALMLSGEAPATILIIPNINAAAIPNQAAKLKFKMESVERAESEDPKAPTIALCSKEKAFQAFISAAMASSADNDGALRSKSASGMSIFQAAAGAAFVGAIGAWTALAFF